MELPTDRSQGRPHLGSPDQQLVDLHQPGGVEEGVGGEVGGLD